MSSPDRSSIEVHLERLALVRATFTVLEDLDLSLKESRLGLIGTDGAGKSSVLRLICGLGTLE